MTKQWFTFAARDLKAAVLMSAHGAKFKHEIAFHIQQSIEKSLKGYLVFHNQRPPRTHSIEELVALMESVDPTLRPLFKNAKRISKYAVSYRYPSEQDKPLSFAVVKTDLAFAKKFFDRLRKEVPSLKVK